MKYLTCNLLLIVFFTIPNISSGQNKNNIQSNYRVQVNLGISRTLHYNKPVGLVQCFEGCFPEEQKPRITPNINVALYRNFNQQNSIRIGLGASSYRYLESGKEGDGGGGFSPYTVTESWSFYGVSLGYRHIFNPLKKIQLFIENDFVYEIPVEEYALIKNGLAVHPKIGIIANINSKWGIIAQGFYKSALINYSDKDYGKAYKPYAYGIEIGANLKL